MEPQPTIRRDVASWSTITPSSSSLLNLHFLKNRRTYRIGDQIVCKRCTDLPHVSHITPDYWRPGNIKSLNIIITTAKYFPLSPDAPTATPDERDCEKEVGRLFRTWRDPDSFPPDTIADPAGAETALVLLHYVASKTSEQLDEEMSLKCNIVRSFATVSISLIRKELQSGTIHCCNHPTELQSEFERKLKYRIHHCSLRPDMVFIRRPENSGISQFLPVVFSRIHTTPQEAPKVPLRKEIAFILAYAQYWFGEFPNETTVKGFVIRFVGRTVRLVSTEVRRSYLGSLENRGWSNRSLQVVVSEPFDTGKPEEAIEFIYALKRVFEEMFPPMPNDPAETLLRARRKRMLDGSVKE